MAYREKIIEGLEMSYKYSNVDEHNTLVSQRLVLNAIEALKEQKAVRPKTIPEELKQKMWNALYAEEGKFEEKYVGTEEHDGWFYIYRPWLQKGFGLAIKAIADWEEGR